MNVITVATHNELPTTLTTRRFSDTPASPMPLDAVVARLGYEPPVVYRWAQYWCVPVAQYQMGVNHERKTKACFKS